ncbi:MAG: hypothetical protein HWQ42_15325 [Nostoc sp. JL23]|nr:hypothetical protein [Nostoc sp. JL23]
MEGKYLYLAKSYPTGTLRSPYDSTKYYFVFVLKALYWEYKWHE